MLGLSKSFTLQIPNVKPTKRQLAIMGYVVKTDPCFRPLGVVFIPETSCGIETEGKLV